VKAQDCERAYNQALVIACRDLDVINPVRLALVLNMSVFMYEINSKPLVAITLSEATIAQAMEKLDDCESTANFTESKNLLDMIRGNISLWVEQMEQKIMEATDS